MKDILLVQKVDGNEDDALLKTKIDGSSKEIIGALCCVFDTLLDDGGEDLLCTALKITRKNHPISEKQEGMLS